MPQIITRQHKIFYREAGRGTLLLILPGQTASSICHLGEIEYFSDRFHAVSLDFWGTGRSERLCRWPVDWWLQGAQDCAELVKQLNHKKCVVMGTSGGAIVALWMAILFPGMVRGVVADSCAEEYSSDALKKIILDRGQRRPEQVLFWQHANGEDWEQVINADSQFLTEIMKKGGHLFDHRLNEIHCPVLFTASMKDIDVPNICDQNSNMAREVKDGRVLLVNEGGHPLMWSAAQEFRCASDSFLKSYVR